MSYLRDIIFFRFLRTPNKKKSLKTQLFSSFGLAAFLSLFVGVISSCFVVSRSGQKLIDRSQDLMVDQVDNRLVSSSELFAVAGRLQFIEESLQIVVESVRDRIAGYPTMEGWETGKFVPFEVEMEGGDNTNQQRRMYPLNEPPVPLDWQISADIDIDGIDNPFLDPRLIKYPTAISSTKSAHYRIPGFYNETSSASSMNRSIELLKSDGLYQSTGDLSVILKPMYETIPEALTLEINFFNGGIGSTLQFPATVTNDTILSKAYNTTGCEWMTTLTNPFTGNPYASEAKCPPPGTETTLRYRHPMESPAVKAAVEFTSQKAEESKSFGPGGEIVNGMESNGGTTTTFPPTNSQRLNRNKILDPLVSWEGPSISEKDNESFILTASKAIYDRITSEFIGVVTIELLESGLADDLQRRTLDDDSEVYLVYAKAGGEGIITGTTPGAKYKIFQQLPQYQEISDALSASYFKRIPEFEQWRNAPNNTIPEPEPLSAIYFTRTNDGGFMVSVPVPSIPEYPWDNSYYSPSAFVVQMIPPTIFNEFDVFADRVQHDVKKNIILCVLLGVFGLVLVLSILAMMSNVLSQPLKWITIVARKVIDNDIHISSNRIENNKSSHGDTVKNVPLSKKPKKRNKKNRKLISRTSMQYCSEGVNSSAEFDSINSIAVNHKSCSNRDLEADDESEDNDDGKVAFVNFDYHPKTNMNVWCNLSTELQQLLESFQSMIHGFSGDGVSKVAEPGLCEIQNSLTWHSEFSKLYERHTEAKNSFNKLSSVRQVSSSTRATTVGSIDTYSVSTTDQSNYHNHDHNIDTTDTSSDSQNFNHGATLSTTIDEGIEQASISHEYPSFCSSLVHDQDSSEESLSPDKQEIPGSRFKLPGPPPKMMQTVIPAPIKVNRTSTLCAPKYDPNSIPQKRERPSQKIKIACCSRLFWWIVVLMALPVLVTNSIIGAIVSSSILLTLPKTWKESAKQGSNNIERDAMQLIADKKAAIMVNLMQGPVRDIYLMTRITNWLIFGAIQRSLHSVSLDSTSENCKGLTKGECPFSLPCACDWEYGWNLTSGNCDMDDSMVDSRYLQRQWYEVQKTDSDPVTGSRRSSPSFPSSLNSSESIIWWKNISDLPGSEVGSSNASGYKTLYDRLIVSSASSVFNFPIYNYASGVRYPRSSFGGYLAFADDGLLVGWSGCDDWHSSLSNFVSTFENGASLVDQDLCANGKYGYDPRCSGWYAQGRESYLQDDLPVLVTPPYKNEMSDQITQTITSPIANPKTGEYVGQIALDFELNYEFIAKMLDEESSLTFMITPHEDILGGDTVVSPRSEKGWASAKIEDLIFTNEPNNSNRDYFKENVLPLMKAGERNDTRFSITNEDGLEEQICLYYTPVKLPLRSGLNPDDFTHGESTAEYLIYSLGVGKPCDEIKRPYDGVEDAVNDGLLFQRDILIAIIVSSTVFFIIFSVVTAIRIAFPMIKLSNIVRNTKKGEYDSIPPLQGGCNEVQSIYNTFAKLNKIVKVSNTAFFSGKLDMAHHFVSDALVLYRKINDRKAIGVTCNNLANTLFAIQYEHMNENNNCHVQQTLELYDEALSHSQQDFDEAEGKLKVDYANQLADRLFNRGLYFLFIDGYDFAPDDSRDRGYNDIIFSRNLHDDIRDFLLENKLLFAKASPYFSRLLRRINCLASFYDDVGLREIWDARILLDEANQLVDAATEAGSTGNFCPLFQEVSRSGRQQQLESLEILLALNCDGIRRAAKTGIRMLVEDAYLLESAFVRSAKALLLLMKEGDDGGDLSFSKRSIEHTRDDLRTMVKSCKKESLEIGKNAVFVMEICPSLWNVSADDGGLQEKLNSHCLWLYDNFFEDNDQIGIVANSINNTLSIDIGSKEDDEGRQRTFLDVATSNHSSCNFHNEESQVGSPHAEASFPIGLQILIESSVSIQSDSYILWVIDGSIRHEHHAMISFRDKIEKLNQERNYEINMLIIGLNRNENGNICRLSRDHEVEHDWVTIEEKILEDIGSLSKNSIYLNVNSEDELTSAFQRFSVIISNNRMTSEFISFLTMEKF